MGLQPFEKERAEKKEWAANICLLLITLLHKTNTPALLEFSHKKSTEHSCYMIVLCFMLFDYD